MLWPDIGIREPKDREPIMTDSMFRVLPFSDDEYRMPPVDGRSK
jgi:hypothetical protein